MKETSVKSCQVCGKYFEGGDIAYYVVIDNSIVCRECAVEAKTEVRERLVTVASSGNDLQEVAKVSTKRCILTNGDDIHLGDSAKLRTRPTLEALKHYVVNRINTNFGMATTARDAGLHNVASHHEGAYEAMLYISMELGIDSAEYNKISDIQKEEYQNQK